MQGFEEKESYLECLGHLIGLEFEPNSGLKLKPKTDTEEKKIAEKDIVIPNVPLNLAKTWKKGALTASLRKYGYAPENTGGKKKPSALGSAAGASGINQSVAERLELLERFKFKTSLQKSKEAVESKERNNPERRRGDGQNVQNQGRKLNAVKEESYLQLLGADELRVGLSKPKRVKLMNNVPIDNTKSAKQDVLFRPFVAPTRKDLENEQEVEKPKESINATSIKSNQSSSGLSNLPRCNGLFSSISSTKPNNVPKVIPQPELPLIKNRTTEENKSRGNEENKPQSEEGSTKQGMFKTAYEQLRINDRAKGIKRNLGAGGPKSPSNNANKLPPPLPLPADSEPPKLSDNPEVNELMMNHEGLKMFEPAIIERILGEVMEPPQEIGWDDVAGLEGPKSIIKEIIIWPLLRPDIFKGLRSAPRGILLFGPPGTGKTMIGRLIATQSKSTFFSISASSLTSKWIGDGEKIVRALFLLARIKQPSVIFIDEIDSIMTQRSDTEHESSRRMKTEFLVQFDGCSTDSEDRVLVIGVTNRPHELDEAARRRLVKRIYIPLPDIEGRKQIVKKLMSDQSSDLSENDYNKIAEITEGYSGADMKNLCHVAANEPIRDISHQLEFIDIADVRPINLDDFISAKEESSKTVAENEMTLYEVFDNSFGCKLKSKQKP